MMAEDSAMAFLPRIIAGGRIPPDETGDLARRNARDGLRLLCAFARIKSREDRLRVIAFAEEIAEAGRFEQRAETV
jgi:hypothetical protein